MLRVFFFITVCICSVWAHKLNIFTQVEENRVHIQSYFASAKGCMKCEVVVMQGDNKILSTFTNNQGEATIELEKGSYSVSVEASGGHKATQTIQMSQSVKADIAQQQAQNMDNLKFNKLLQTVTALLGLIAIILFLKRIKS